MAQMDIQGRTLKNINKQMNGSLPRGRNQHFLYPYLLKIFLLLGIYMSVCV